MKNLKTAYILNLCLFALEVFAIGWMMSGLSGGGLSASRLATLKYFTVDSNILMGICALWAAIEHKRVLDGKQDDISPGCYAAQLTGVTGVTLTMLVSAFFLAPRLGFTFVFQDSNFFLHLVNPVLAIIIFLFFEKSKKIPFRHTFTAVVPLALYAIYYVVITLSHYKNGVIEKGYDWYGFFFKGPSSVFIVLPVILVLTYGISFCLWKLNRKPAAK